MPLNYNVKQSDTGGGGGYNTTLTIKPPKKKNPKPLWDYTQTNSYNPYAQPAYEIYGGSNGKQLNLPPAVRPPAAVPTQPQRGIGAWFTDVYGGIKSWFNDIGSGSYKYVPPAVSSHWSGYGNPTPAASTYSGWTTPPAYTVNNTPPTQAGGYWRGTNANYSTAPTDNTAQYSPRAMAGVPQNTFQYNRTYWSTGNQSHDPSFFRRAGQRLVADWQAAGGVNIPITDWFDPYDPAGSPYMQSQYQPVAESAGGYGGWGGGGGWGGWGGWGGGGGGGFTPMPSSPGYTGYGGGYNPSRSPRPAYYQGRYGSSGGGGGYVGSQSQRGAWYGALLQWNI